MELPSKNFVDLLTAQNSPEFSDVSIIGIVVDLMPPTITSKQMYMITLRLMDPALHQHIIDTEGHYSGTGHGLTVRAFKHDREDLPKVNNVGDIVLLRGAQRKAYRGQPLLVLNSNTVSLVFPGASIPAKAFEISVQGRHRLECLGAPMHRDAVSVAEQGYVIALKEQMSGAVFVTGTRAGMRNGASGSDERSRYGGNSRPPAAGHGPGGDGGRSFVVPTGPKRAGEPLPPTAPKRMRESGLGKKFCLVEDLRHYMFADLCVQVVKIFMNNYGCDLYVTDYTENPQMFSYADPEMTKNQDFDGDSFGYQQSRKWPGPYGKYVLMVNVKDPHASYIHRLVHEGDFVQLKNVKMKFREERNLLIGDMWPDDLHRGRVNVVRVTDFGLPELAAVEERRERYWNDRKQALNPEPAAPKMTETEKRKRKKERKKERRAEQERTSNDASLQQGQQKPGAEAATTTDVPTVKRANVNPHMRCSHLDVTLTPVRNIRDADDKYHMHLTRRGDSYKLPFVNVKHRARVRCIDFAPKDMSAFARIAEVDDGQSESDDDYPTSISQKWEWGFSLLLEDVQRPPGNDSDPSAEGNAIWVTIGHTEAQYLLGNTMPDPCNLKQDLRMLAQLRERMYILWGNLAETFGDGHDAGKRPALSNLPFECCIAEFGIPVPEHAPDGPGSSNDPEDFGWRRAYRMFGVTIL